MNSTSSYSSEQPLDADATQPEAKQPASEAAKAPAKTPARKRKFRPNSAEDQVHIGVVAPTALAHGTPPNSNACVLHGDEPVSGFTRVVMKPEAIAQVKAHAESNTRVELGGLLLGHVYTHNQQTFVEVHEAIPAKTEDNGSVHFTFTADTWKQLNVASEAFPDLTPVGWFHTHPDLGVFFSSDDEVVHATFPHRWMVGLVVDPVREQVNYFGWLKNQILPIGGFYELTAAATADSEPQATMPWNVTIDESFFFNPTRYLPAGVGIDRVPFDDGLPAISPWVGALLGGTSLLISLVTLGVVLYYHYWL